MLCRSFHARFLALAFALGGGCKGEASAQVSPTPVITADTLEVDLARREAIYQGNARAEFGDVMFVADEIRWNQTASVATATGHAVLQRDDLRLVAEQLTYALATNTYEVTGARLGRDPYYFASTTLTGTADAWVFQDATLSFGEPGPWAPSLRAQTLTYDPVKQRIRATGGRMGLGRFSGVPLPAVSLSLDAPELFEITVDGGASGQLGLFGRMAATLPIGERWRAGADVGIYTNRGIMAGPAGGYDWSNPDGTLATGRFTSGYIHDGGDRRDLGDDALGQPIDADRGLISWQHRQIISPRLTLNGELNYWSDSEVLRDFRREEFFPVQVPDTFVELTYTSTNTLSGVFLRVQPNNFHLMRERLPELTWELLPSPLGAGLLHQAQASFVSLRDDPPGPATEVTSNRLDFYYAVSRPWQPRSWFSFDPVAGLRVTHYADARGGKSDYTRTLGEVGADAEMRFAGTFDYKNPTWGIDGLRHLVTPRLAYRYIPDAADGTAYIPAIDRRVFATYLEPLGLGARRQIDDLSRTHTLRVALDQRLQTRDVTYGSRDLVQLNVAIDSRFEPPIGQRTLSALHTELRLSPAPFLDVDLYHRATPGDWTLRELNTAITLHDADQWELQFANHYLEGDIQEFIGAFAYRLNEVWQGYTRLHFDARRSRFVEQTYGLRQTIANRWAIGYEVSLYEGQRRESDFGFAIRFDAVQF